MALCVDNNNADAYGGMPNNSNDATRPNASKSDMHSKSFMDMIREQDAHEAEVASVSEAISTDPGDVTAQAQAIAKSAGVQSVSKELEKMIVRAIEATNEDRIMNIQAVSDQLANATVGKLSWYAKAAMNMATWLSNDRASIMGYMQKYFGVPGTTVEAHYVIQAMNQARADYAGVMTQVQNYLNDTFGRDERILKIAKDTGLDIETVLDAGGNWRNFEHALDRNAYGYEKMKDQVAALEEKLRTVGDPDEARVLRDEHKHLLQRIKDYEELSEAMDKPKHRYMPAGYTNAQARYGLENYSRRVNIPVDDLRYVSDKMGQFAQFIENLLIDNGVITPELVAGLGNLPEQFVRSYVPMRTRKGNMSGALNDSDVYTDRTYRAFTGMSETPDSAWATLQFFAHRAAKDIGYKAFGQALGAAFNRAVAREGIKLSKSGMLLGKTTSGLQAHRYSTVLARALGPESSGDAIRARMMLNTRDGGGGIVTTMDVVGKDGVARPERVLINFDRDWSDADMKVSGADLNRALSIDEIRNESSEFVKRVTGATSAYGQLFTRFTPAFAPVNGMRDVAERFVNMMSRDYVDLEGKNVAGWTLAPKYAANTARAFTSLFDIVTKNVDPNSYIGQMWNEYVNAGLYMNPSRHVGLENQPSKFNARTGKVERRFVDNLLDAGGGAGRKAMAFIDGYNDWFNNIASFAHYLTLREANVPARRAASGVLEMMNLYNRGTFTDGFRALYPFVKPTIQSGVALSRTLGLAPDAAGKFRPNVRGMATFAGLYALASQLYPAIHRAMGQDEDGNWRADTLSMSQWQSFWPIPIDDDGNYFKVANGFGLIQAAITAAIGADRVERGLMQPEDLAFELMFAVGKNVTPGNFPEFNMSTDPAAWFARMISPSVLMPVVELATNRNYLGGQIYFKKDEWTSRADSGLATTQKNYHEFAKLLRDVTGGYLDLAPEQVRAILNDIAIGPFRFISTAVDSGAIGVNNGELRRKDTKRLTIVEDVGPWWTAMGATRFFGRTGDTNRSLFYQALNAMQERARRDGVDLSSAGTSGKEEGDAKRRENLLKAGWSVEDADDAVMLWRAERDLRKVARDFSGSFKNIWDSAETSDDIKPAMDKFADDRIAIFRKVVQSLNYYRNAGQP